MNKKLARLLRTNSVLYILCLVAFTAASALVDWRLAAVEAVVLLAVLLFGRSRSKKTQQSMRQYMDRIAGGTEAAAFVRKVDFAPSNVAFDAAIATK